MDSEPNSPESLLIVSSEFEASLIVQELATRGIDAYSLGGHTAGFRAEAPGDVTVVVRHSDLDHAKIVIAEYEKNLGQLDWSSIDVGPPEDL